MVFEQKLLGKAYFIVKMLLQPWSGRPVLTFGKRPKSTEERQTSAIIGEISNSDLETGKNGPKSGVSRES